MRALYHRPGNHYHAVRDFNGQFPLRLRVGSLFPVMLQQGALLLCAPLVSSSKNKPTVKKGRGELTDMFWDNKRCMFFFFFFFFTQGITVVVYSLSNLRSKCLELRTLYIGLVGCMLGGKQNDGNCVMGHRMCDVSGNCPVGAHVIGLMQARENAWGRLPSVTHDTT